MLTNYRTVLSVPGALRFSLTGLVARLPISMIGLGIVVLVAERSGSYAYAGAVAAVYILANAVLSIVHGRLVDSFGQARVLSIVISIFGLALAMLLGLVITDAPRWSIYLAAAVMGAALPQVGGCVRARWSYVLAGKPADVHTAYALEGVADEVVFIAGPVLVTLLSTTVHPAAGLLTALLAGVLGTWAFAAQRSTEPPAHRRSTQPRDMAAMPWLLVAAVAGIYTALGALFGATEVATVAFADDRGQTQYAGVLLALWSLGSLLAGIAVGAVQWRRGPLHRVRWGSLTLTLSLAPLGFVGSTALLGMVLFVAGFAISPTLIGCLSLIEQIVPRHRLTEGLAVVHTGIAAGLAPGAALAGLVVDRAGPSTAYWVAVASGAVAVAIAWSISLHSRRPRQSDRLSPAQR